MSDEPTIPRLAVGSLADILGMPEASGYGIFDPAEDDPSFAEASAPDDLELLVEWHNGLLDKLDKVTAERDALNHAYNEARQDYLAAATERARLADQLTAHHKEMARRQGIRSPILGVPCPICMAADETAELDGSDQ